MVLLEEHVGGFIGQATAAGCASYAAYLLKHGGDPTPMLDALGTHHFASFKLVSEVSFVAAALMTSAAEPLVPDCSEALGATIYYLFGYDSAACFIARAGLLRGPTAVGATRIHVFVWI